MDKPEISGIQRLHHISEAIDRILLFCTGKSQTDFLHDHMLNSSVLYQFIIIGETIRSVNQELLDKYPYPWHLPKSFRNYIMHEYFEINLIKVYKTITELLPEFKTVIDQMIKKESKN